MSNELLQKAIECLSIADVYLRESSLSMLPDFDPVRGGTFSVQYRIDAKKFEHLAFEQAPETRFVRIYVETGMRLVDSGYEQAVQENQEAAKQHVKAEILATFVLVYGNKCSDISDGALEIFSKKNAPFHVWPYWREHIHNLCARAHLPIAMLPMFSTKTTSNQAQGSEKIVKTS